MSSRNAVGFFRAEWRLSFLVERLAVPLTEGTHGTVTELHMGLPVRNEDHWLWIGGPVPRGSAAITLGSLVVVRSEAAMSEHFAELLRHERVHVGQWQELGAVRFLGQYLGSYAKFRLRGYGHDAAYRRIPLEIAAVVIARAGRPPVAQNVPQELVTN